MAKLTGKAKAKFLARMKKGRKAAKKKGGGAKRKTSSVKRLESRIEDLERQLSKLNAAISSTGGGEYPDVLSRIKSGELSSARKELKKELDAGDW